MARRHLQSLLSENEQDLNEVWEWYLSQGSLIGEEAARTLDALLAGRPLNQPRYFGKTSDELADLFDGQRAELNKVTMLVLLAAAEAALRVDYIVRVIEDKKDAVSRDFAALYKRSELKIDLEKELLEVWRGQHAARPAIKSAVAEFKEALKLRHWLAHGRYWKPRLGRDYDPHDVFAICDDLLRAASIR